MTPDITEGSTDPLDAAADASSTPENRTPGGDLSAREAVRRAVADRGAEVELDEVLAHLQAKYGLTPPRGTAQSYLSVARKDARDGLVSEPRRRGRPRKATPNGQPSAPPRPAVEAVIEAVEVLRDLCDRLGDDNLRRLLDAL